MGLLLWPYQLLGSLFFFFCCQFTCSASPFSSSAHHLCPHEQSFVLLQFKQLLSINSDASFSCDDPYPKIVSWKEDTDCCSWDGVKCHSLTGHVIGLDLTCSNLKGTIHSNSTLFQVTHLQRLNLANNDFNLSLISTEFGRFPSLTHLNLSESGFSGQIPLEIFLLSKLVSLDLSYCELGKVEPKNFKMLLQDLNQIQDLYLDYIDLSSSDFLLDSLANLSSLTSLSLSNCQLQGKFPDTIFHLPNLQTLILEENFDLTGYLPLFNCNSSCPLSFLDISSCHFSGSIPESIGNLTKITRLFLPGNQFTGLVPSTLSQLSQLVCLDLSSNHLEGQIPNVFANLTHLVYLDLSSTRLTGELPDSIYHLKSLQHLILSNCEITGSIPKSLGYLAENGQAPSTISNVEQLTDLDQLTGYIPSNISGLPSLSILMLSNNLLNGTIPSWLFALPSLRQLGLGSNRFSGQIHEFGHKSLEDIDLSNNELEGPIPQSIFQLVNLTHLLLSSNNLSGIVELDMFSNLQRFRVLGLSYNNRLLFSTNNNVNFTLPNFEELLLRSCKVTEFPDFLRTLRHLRVLDLSDNEIHGQIPEWLRDVGKFSMIDLNLSHNFLTGLDRLPWSWRDLLNLDLHSNFLQGQLPVLPITVRAFLISQNKLTGEIPSSICNLSYLGILDLSNNNLTGKIPECLGSFSEDISVINLRRNNFHGTIPQTFVHGSKLRALDISHNHLQGLVPRSLANSTKLEILDMGYNMIVDTFPFWLETLPELKVLVLRSNRFHGPIGRPRSTSAFIKLNIIDISHNDFVGNLPSEYTESWTAMMRVDEQLSRLNDSANGNNYYFDSVVVTMKGRELELVRILSIFKAIDFSNNKFEGEIPESVGKLKSLCGLNFSSNGLTGYIPSSLGNLTDVESLDLSKNMLSGNIPQQLTSLTFLAVFDVSQNHLTGPIPRGQQFETFSNTSYEGNSGLCGFPMSVKCGGVKVELPPSSPDRQSHNFVFIMDGFGWKAVLMGYGSGAIIGMLLGNYIFQKREEWFMEIFSVGQHRRRKRKKKVRQTHGGR